MPTERLTDETGYWGEWSEVGHWLLERKTACGLKVPPVTSQRAVSGIYLDTEQPTLGVPPCKRCLRAWRRQYLKRNWRDHGKPL